MGLFGKVFGGIYNRAGALLLNGGWQPDGTGVLDGGDDCDDIQAGASFSVRFVHPDMPGSLITVTFYPVEDCPDGFAVERQVEWLVCENPADPGGTEVWSEVETDRPMAGSFGTAGEAEADARYIAEDALANAWVYEWDGQPDWSAA